jgi:hypothetical protein
MKPVIRKATNGHPKFNIERALDKFWKEIARQHPEIKTGDCDPLIILELHHCAAQAVNHWLEVNK